MVENQYQNWLRYKVTRSSKVINMAKNRGMDLDQLYGDLQKAFTYNTPRPDKQGNRERSILEDFSPFSQSYSHIPLEELVTGNVPLEGIKSYTSPKEFLERIARYIVNFLPGAHVPYSFSHNRLLSHYGPFNVNHRRRFYTDFLRDYINSYKGNINKNTLLQHLNNYQHPDLETATNIIRLISLPIGLRQSTASKIFHDYIEEHQPNISEIKQQEDLNFPRENTRENLFQNFIDSSIDRAHRHTDPKQHMLQIMLNHSSQSQHANTIKELVNEHLFGNTREPK